MTTSVQARTGSRTSANLAARVSRQPIPDGGLKKFLLDDWDVKLRKLINVIGNPQAQKLYSQLKELKERVRNPFAHGGVENDRGSLFVHVPSVGALPANFTRFKNSVRFDFLPLVKEKHGSACALFDAVDELLRSGPLATAYSLLEAGVDPSFDTATLATYAEVVSASATDREMFIERWHYENDRHSNMDY
jgi:hypothetical protein